MNTEGLVKLATVRRQIDSKIKTETAALGEKLGPAKAKLKQIDEKLVKYVNKTGKEGTLKSFKLPDDSSVFASESDKYSIKDRPEVDAWVLEKLEDKIARLKAEYVLEGGPEGDEDVRELIGDDLEELQEIHASIANRLGIFSNTIVKDAAIAHRKDTGATDVEGSLKGGKLPGGIRMFKQMTVNYRKG